MILKKQRITNKEDEMTIDYTHEEKEYWTELREKLEFAKEQRDDSHIEFDDMSYVEYYESNAKIANAYNPAPKNIQDRRMTTGIVHEKSVSLLSTILNYNLEPNIFAYNKENMFIDELGSNIEELVQKSRKMEDYDLKRTLIYKELLDQGTVFVEELWEEPVKIEKTIENFNFSDSIDINKIKWSTKVKKEGGKCNVNLLCGLNVYLGNFYEFFIHKQPFLFTREVLTWQQFCQIFSKWDRFKYVSSMFNNVIDDDSTDFCWTLEEQENDNFVEIIKYQDRTNNEYQIIANGVMMLPIGFPLTFFSPSGEYTVSKGDIEPIRKNFAISKSIPAKTKIDGNLLDKIIRSMMLKTELSFNPSLVNRSDQVISKNIFLPAQITSNINPEDITPLIDTKGVTNAEFNFFQFLKKIIDEKSVNSVFSGEGMSGTQTATEIMKLDRRQRVKLLLSISGIIELERQMAWLRVNNILTNWTQPIDTKIDKTKNKVKRTYQSFSVEKNSSSGEKQEKIFEFNDDLNNIKTKKDLEKYSYRLKGEEDTLAKEKNRKIKKVILNPEKLSKLETLFYINITPTEKDNDELNKTLFKQNIIDYLNIFGSFENVDLDYLKRKFAMNAGLDADKLFQKSKPQKVANNGVQQPNGLQGNTNKNLASATQEPSLNTLMQKK